MLGLGPYGKRRCEDKEVGERINGVRH